tara:strand:+ start:95327 stop:96256 length:930 start_codon:yes stop_codon:yes gene_type:complete
MAKVANTLRSYQEQNKDHVTKSNQFLVDIDKIHEDPGFNTRLYERPDVEEHINKLADAYEAGEDLPPLLVKVIDGKVILRDGYCRIRGARIAKGRGAEIPRLPVKEVRGDEVDQSLVILTSNDGLKLTSLERAAVYVRLVGMNLTEDEVAKRIRKTREHVRQYLALYDLPVKIKELINADRIAWTLALELYNEHGTKAIEIIEAADQEANSKSGKNKKPKRVTRKAVDKNSGYRSRITGQLVRDVTDSISSVVSGLRTADRENDGSALVRLSQEQIEALEGLHKQIKPAQDPDQNQEELELSSPEEAVA